VRAELKENAEYAEELKLRVSLRPFLAGAAASTQLFGLDGGVKLTWGRCLWRCDAESGAKVDDEREISLDKIT